MYVKCKIINMVIGLGQQPYRNWAGPVSAQLRWLGRVQPKKNKRRRRKAVGPLVGPMQ